MQLDANKIKDIKEYFEGKPVLKAYLFGSYAKGEASDTSDIDILVDIDYSQKVGLQFFQMKVDLENLLKTKVDLVSSNGLSKHIEPQITNERKLIYAKQKRR